MKKEEERRRRMETNPGRGVVLLQPLLQRLPPQHLLVLQVAVRLLRELAEPLARKQLQQPAQRHMQKPPLASGECLLMRKKSPNHSGIAHRWRAGGLCSRIERPRKAAQKSQ